MKYYIITVHSFYGSSVEAMYPRFTFGPFVWTDTTDAELKVETLNKRLYFLKLDMLAQYQTFDLDNQKPIPKEDDVLKAYLDFESDEEYAE